jgi:hypothetical protein
MATYRVMMWHPTWTMTMMTWHPTCGILRDDDMASYMYDDTTSYVDDDVATISAWHIKILTHHSPI